MSPPLLGVVEGEEPPGVLKEHNYFGTSDSSSVDSSTPTSLCMSRHHHHHHHQHSKDKDDLNLQSHHHHHHQLSNDKDKDNLKATELRLGLPGSLSPPRDEKPLFPFTPHKSAVSGTKRALDNSPSHHNWMFHSSNHLNSTTATLSSSTPPTTTDTSTPPKPHQKAQVVGWPPIRSFRKNTLATTSKSSEPLFVKVSMDGAPYLRKVDLTTYTCYQQLSSALETMFTCFTLGQCGRENLSETKLKDLLNGSEYVLTYEDKDGDWMLVGDVPWEMFIDTCKRLKIMKSSDAIGLAPRAMEKSKMRS